MATITVNIFPIYENTIGKVWNEPHIAHTYGKGDEAASFSTSHLVKLVGINLNQPVYMLLLNSEYSEVMEVESIPLTRR